MNVKFLTVLEKAFSCPNDQPSPVTVVSGDARIITSPVIYEEFNARREVWKFFEDSVATVPDAFGAEIVAAGYAQAV